MVVVQGESRKFLDRINMIDRIMNNGYGLNPVNPVNPVQEQKIERSQLARIAGKCRRLVRLRATRCGEI